MTWEIIIQTTLLFTLIILTFLAIEMKDLLYAVIILAGSSVTLALIFYMLQAPDIAITEAAVNAGVATAIYVIAISKTKREEIS
ncbi:MAG: hydrogenase subunit MbhD domain-containing protein [Candidatus Hadarchaeia archaeon]